MCLLKDVVVKYVIEKEVLVEDVVLILITFSDTERRVGLYMSVDLHLSVCYGNVPYPARRHRSSIRTWPHRYRSSKTCSTWMDIAISQDWSMMLSTIEVVIGRYPLSAGKSLWYPSKDCSVFLCMTKDPLNSLKILWICVSRQIPVSGRSSIWKERPNTNDTSDGASYAPKLGHLEMCH